MWRSTSSPGHYGSTIFFTLLALSLPLSTLAEEAAAAPTCAVASITAKYPTPSMAPGFTARLVANGFNVPRSLAFDSQGHLLVLEQSVGVTVLTLNDAGGDCISVASQNTIINNYTLNHGLQLSPDSSVLYASNNNGAFAWGYNPKTGQLTSGVSKTIVTGMTGGDHQTRTLLVSQKFPNYLLVSRGSDDNIDDNALLKTNGHCMIKAFDMSKLGNTPFNYVTDGTLLGWGLRNSVGVGEHPTTGGIFSVENSVDNIQRNGVDFHQDDPGEELNFHGFLNGSDGGVQGSNYGYPNCVSAWSTDIPDGNGLSTGSPIAFGDLTDTNSDANCAADTTAARLTFQAHWAPLDILFNSNGTVGYVTSHGSSDRTQPIGYLLLGIPWNSVTGQPVAEPTEQNSYVPIMSNQDDANCPDSCFRPTGLAFDSKGRLWMTSDVTGEIYVITADDGSSVDAINGTIAADGTGNGGSGSGSNGGSTGGGDSDGGSSHQGAAAHTYGQGIGKEYLVGLVVAMLATVFLT